MEKENKKNNYLSPQLTVVEFKEERGYSISNAVYKTENDLRLFEYNSSNPNVTQYEEDNSWAGYSWN